jgi:hypothetical protein
MTFQPPPPPPPPGGPTPPPPPGAQPPYGSPPPGAQPPYGAQPPSQQWGAPPPATGGYPPPAAFDPKTVNPLDWGILAAGFLAFIFSFVSYYSYKISIAGFTSGTGHWNAWHGFFGWFAMFCALVGSALVGISLFAPQVKLPMPARLLGLGAYALATLCVILALFIVPSPGGYSGSGLDKGHAFGYWISLIVILAGLVLSLMRFQESGGQLPGALSKMPNIGGHRPGGTPPPPPPPPPGYGPPAP